jgi:hypothetical protein
LGPLFAKISQRTAADRQGETHLSLLKQKAEISRQVQGPLLISAPAEVLVRRALFLGEVVVGTVVVVGDVGVALLVLVLLIALEPAGTLVERSGSPVERLLRRALILAPR